MVRHRSRSHPQGSFLSSAAAAGQAGAEDLMDGFPSSLTRLCWGHRMPGRGSRAEGDVVCVLPPPPGVHHEIAEAGAGGHRAERGGREGRPAGFDWSVGGGGGGHRLDDRHQYRPGRRRVVR